MKIVFVMVLILTHLYGENEELRLGKQIKDQLIEDSKRARSVREIVEQVGEVEEKEIVKVDSFNKMFEEGVLAGKIRAMYSEYDYKSSSSRVYATAIGGTLKYELAQFNGFNAGVAISAIHDIDLLTGNGEKFNPGLSSSQGSYTQLTEAYLNYKYKDLNLRGGRQVLETPLADSDDIRMVSNTFEAYVATFKFRRWTFMAGKLQQWQGSDADLDKSWQSTGDDGTYFGGVSLSKVLLDFDLWYYDFSQDTSANNTIGNIANTSGYISLSLHGNASEDVFLHVDMQYLHQEESDNSAIETDIYGVTAEVEVNGLGFSVAYNQSEKEEGKGSFSGYGGGTLYTNMDNMILDNITLDRQARAIVAGVTYSIESLGFLYAYGDFYGKSNSFGEKEHIVEQDIGVEYIFNDDLVLAAIYVISEDKERVPENDDYDWKNMRVWLNYSF